MHNTVTLAITPPVVASGIAVARTSRTRMSQSTATPPIDQAMLVMRAARVPPAANSGVKRNVYASAPTVSVTSIVSRSSSRSTRRGCARPSFATATKKQTKTPTKPTSASDG